MCPQGRFSNIAALQTGPGQRVHSFTAYIKAVHYVQKLSIILYTYETPDTLGGRSRPNNHLVATPNQTQSRILCTTPKHDLHRHLYSIHAPSTSQSTPTHPVPFLQPYHVRWCTTNASVFLYAGALDSKAIALAG
jgi:hypothetical protein